MIQSMWFNLHVQDLEKSAQFYKALGFKINRNPQMLDKMVGIQIGQTTVILIENKHFQNVSQQSLNTEPNEVMISLGVNTNEEVDQLVNKSEKSGWHSRSRTNSKPRVLWCNVQKILMDTILIFSLLK